MSGPPGSMPGNSAASPPGAGAAGMSPPGGGAYGGAPGASGPPGGGAPGMSPPGAAAAGATPPGGGAYGGAPGVSGPPGGAPGTSGPPGGGAYGGAPGVSGPPGGGAPGMSPPGAGAYTGGPGAAGANIPGAAGASIPGAGAYTGGPGAAGAGAAGAGAAPGTAPGVPGLPGGYGGGPPGPGGIPGGIPGGFPGIPGGGPGIPGGSPGNTAPAEPVTISDFVQLAFREGRDGDAYQLLALDAITSGASLKEMKRMSGTKRMAPAVHVAIGISYQGSRAISSPEPIGGGGGSGMGGMPGMGPPGMPGVPGMAGGGKGNRRPPSGTNNNRNRPGGQPGGGTNQKPDLFKAPEEPFAQLSFYTGELGDKVLENLRKRIEKGDFGKPVRDAIKNGGGVAAAAGAMPGGMPGGYGGAPGAGAPGVPGLPGGAPGAGAPAMPGLPGAGRGGPGMPGGSTASAAVGNQLMPGVTMVGEGAQGDLVKKAAAANCHVLILYNVECRQGPNSVINTTSIKVLSVVSKETIYNGAGLVAGNVEKAREEKKGADPVDAEISKLFGTIDDKVVPTALKTEAANAERVAAYVDTLVKEKHSNPLPILAEIKYLQSVSLISGDKLNETYGTILGTDVGAKVATGEPDEVLQALASWLPDQRPKTLTASDAKKGSVLGGFIDKLRGK
ncbi:MAG: hypothetical protein ACKOBW_02580 [Planctomycetota bacterium]